MDKKTKDKYLFKTYGISLATYEALFKHQNGKCAICGNPPKNKSLNVDHRHVKKFKAMEPCQKRKEVRGLLCFKCNKFLMGALENYKNPREVLAALNEYCRIYKLKND